MRRNSLHGPGAGSRQEQSAPRTLLPHASIPANGRSSAGRMNAGSMIVDPRRLGIRLLFFGFLAGVLARAAGARDWPQWGSNPAHQGASAAVGQPLVSVLADIVYDPFVEHRYEGLPHRHAGSLVGG